MRKIRLNTVIQSGTRDWTGAASGTERGIALLMVLWVLTILTVIVFSFSYMARTEAYAALSFRQTVEKKFLAEAGIERGIAELFYLNENRNAPTVIAGSEVWRTDGRRYKLLTDNGYYTISIVNESGKVDINTTPELILKTLLLNLGVNADHTETIVDSIMDWKDPDNLHRLHGAEDDYYMSLPNPYKAKNAYFETLEELLLIKGMTPEILYGDRGKKGIIDFLTVHSGAKQININAAPKEVLLAIPGITPELADALLAVRETREIQDIQGVLGNNYSLASRYIGLMQAISFTIESAGFIGTERAGYPLRATITLDGNNRFKYNYYKSPADSAP
ncbi:MAG: general secretion pathway protein GspK [Nitrospirae bacterium]|nr:general secretion pathway protein GspK [Nitrospirota bacterium]